MENAQKRPEWSQNYPAIDGIAKPDRDFREYDMAGSYCTPAEQPIRSDIASLLNKAPEDFAEWYQERQETTELLLSLYSTFASIPNLNYGSEDQQLGQDSATVIKNQIECFEQGLEHLAIIKRVYENRQNIEDIAVYLAKE